MAPLITSVAGGIPSLLARAGRAIRGHSELVLAGRNLAQHSPGSLCERVVALLAAGALGFEGLRILWHWAATYSGPKWAGVLFRFAVTATVGGLALFGTVLFIGIAFVLF